MVETPPAARGEPGAAISSGAGAAPTLCRAPDPVIRDFAGIISVSFKTELCGGWEEHGPSLKGNLGARHQTLVLLPRSGWDA